MSDGLPPQGGSVQAQITVCTPVGPGHELLLPRAQASVQAQTVTCRHLVIHDLDSLGAGVMRNRLLAEVKTAFVVFLDADDWLEPEFAEHCLRAWQVGKYVYTDWYEETSRGTLTREAPCLRVKGDSPTGAGQNGDGVISVAGQHPWCGGSYHTVTTLLPADMARAVGGFDETLPALEDTDFYLKLCASRRCGIRVAEPLFHYGREGVRSRPFHDENKRRPILQTIAERYKGQMGCCGDDVQQVKVPPAGERQPGDILAQAIWLGHQRKVGRVTGRLYPRIGRPAVAWVDPRDVKVSPDWWLPAPQEAPAPNGARIGDAPVLTSSKQVADYLNAVTGGGHSQTQSIVYEVPQPRPQDVPVRPDVAGVLAKVSGVQIPTPPVAAYFNPGPEPELKPKRGRPKSKR